MTKAQQRLRQLQERRSRQRQRMAELGLADALTDETRQELDTIEAGTPDLERQLRCAQVAVDAEEAEQRESGGAAKAPDADAETRERADLRRKVSLGRYVGAAIEQRGAEGAEAEYNAALGIAANRFPLELLAPVETRATTDTDTMATPRRWIDRLFAETAAQSVGITMESVPTGAASFPVTTGGASAAQRGRTEAAADAAWTIGVTELKPSRNAVRAVFSVEDAARIPGLESALTRDLRAALTEGIDRAVFLGDDGATGTTADVTGLQAAAGLTEKTITQANKVKGSNVLQAFAELIDGKHATTPGQLRGVLSVPASVLWSHQLANTGASVDTTVAEFLRRWGFGWMAREGLGANTDADSFGGYVGLGRGIQGAGVAAVWEAGELIRDPYTSAAKGEIALTLTYLWAFGLPRASNFARIKFVT